MSLTSWPGCRHAEPRNWPPLLEAVCSLQSKGLSAERAFHSRQLTLSVLSGVSGAAAGGGGGGCGAGGPGRSRRAGGAVGLAAAAAAKEAPQHHLAGLAVPVRRRRHAPPRRVCACGQICIHEPWTRCVCV